MQGDRLQEKALIDNNPQVKLGSLYDDAGCQPKFWAAASVWERLEDKGQIAVSLSNTKFSFASKAQPQQGRVNNWVFVVSYNRFETTRKDQILLDWSDAAQDSNTKHAAGYVRVLVIRPEQEQIEVGMLPTAWCTLRTLLTLCCM